MKFLLLCIIGIGALSADPPSKSHILFLMHQRQVPKAINAYFNYRTELGRDDLEVLEGMCLALLEMGLKSEEEESFIALYGANFCGFSKIIHFCELALERNNPSLQLAALNILGNHQDDAATTAIFKAFSSPFLPVRIDAAYYLALKKHPKAVGQIEAIRQKLPQNFHYVFPDLLALSGDREAINILKTMIAHSPLYTRVMALIAAAKFQRDDLISQLRSVATHPNAAEQEAAVRSLCLLGDVQVGAIAKKRLNEQESCVKIASALALHQLGDEKGKQTLVELARKQNPFAIATLAEVKSEKELLFTLTKHRDIDVRFNAALALLHLKDSRAIATLLEIAFARTSMSFEPRFSPGRTQLYWHALCATGFPKEQKEALENITVQLKEKILADSIELEERDFLSFIEKVVEKHDRSMLPIIVELLANKKTEGVLVFLKNLSQKAGLPLVRTCATLALYRIDKKPEDRKVLVDWLKSQKQHEIIRFRPVEPKADALFPSPFVLTPGETSALFINVCMALADEGSRENVDTLLTLLRDTNPKNCYLLAGLILKAIQ